MQPRAYTARSNLHASTPRHGQLSDNRSPWRQIQHRRQHSLPSKPAAPKQRCSQQCHATLQLDQQFKQNPSSGQQTAPDHNASQHSFSWTKQWYPVALDKDLETYRPNAIKLLGKDLVLWKDGDSEWRCFDDVCPHRLVPLSEGRIETDGTLQCAYHGWRFNAEGACTTIPQAESAEAERKSAGHPRACVPKYPVQVQHHLVWVWGDASPNAQLECLSKQPAVIEQLQHEDQVLYLHPWFMREMPYGHDILLENVLDPSHVPFSHHGVIGDRNKVMPSSMQTIDPLQESGFTVGIAVNKNGTNRAHEGSGKMTKLNFTPPTLVKYKFGGPGMQMITYCTPTSPGRSRLFYCFVADKQNAPAAMKRAIGLKPDWLNFLNHFQRNLVLDGDGVFLHGQDRKTHQGPEVPKYYMPTSMDQGVSSLRHWLTNMAGPIPWGVEATPEIWSKDYTRHEMLDRYDQHTKHCKNCSKALQVVSLAQKAAVAVMAVTALLAAAAVGAGNSSVPVWGGLGTGAVLAAVAAWQLGLLRQKFIFVDYVQADH
ncbi:hypothetical protein ABBQ32_010732 [Trebouxia sp. C0010 RCD-2024]